MLFLGGTATAMDEIRIIKKYQNRRLYDTELCLYITLNDVKKLVFDHVKFQVIDAQTKKDLTQSTLLQIIAEQEATSTPIFTTALLQDLIRSYQKKSQHAFTQYLEQTMEFFLHQKSFLENQWIAYQKLFTKPQTTTHDKNEKNQFKPKLKKTNKNPG